MLPVRPSFVAPFRIQYTKTIQSFCPVYGSDSEESEEEEWEEDWEAEDGEEGVEEEEAAAQAVISREMEVPVAAS